MPHGVIVCRIGVSPMSGYLQRAEPFGKPVAAQDLLSRPSRQEAVARVRFCVEQPVLGVMVCEVGSGRMVPSHAAVGQLNPPPVPRGEQYGEMLAQTRPVGRLGLRRTTPFALRLFRGRMWSIRVILLKRNGPLGHLIRATPTATRPRSAR
jgi:hypothetical protein